VNLVNLPSGNLVQRVSEDAALESLNSAILIPQSGSDKKGVSR